MCGSGIGAGFAEAVFSSVKKPGDVLVMLGYDNDGHDKDDGDEPGAIGGVGQDHGEDGERDGGEDGGERNVFRKGEDDDEEEEPGDRGEWGEGQEDSESGCDAFAAFELEPDGVDVAEDGAERGESFSVLERDGREAGCEDDSAGEPDGEESFAGIEDEGENAELFCAGADDIGGSDVAAALFADVLLEEKADEDESEGDGAEEVSGEANQEVREYGHRA